MSLKKVYWVAPKVQFLARRCRRHVYSEMNSELVCLASKITYVRSGWSCRHPNRCQSGKSPHRKFPWGPGGHRKYPSRCVPDNWVEKGLRCCREWWRLENGREGKSEIGRRKESRTPNSCIVELKERPTSWRSGKRMLISRGSASRTRTTLEQDRGFKETEGSNKYSRIFILLCKIL